MDEIKAVYKKGSLVEVDKDAESYVIRVMEDIKSIQKDYMRLGFHLDEINRCKYHEKLGYDNFYEFCLYNYKMDKSAVSRCINVFKRFSDKSKDKNELPGINKMWINPAYKEYSYSQLCEMVTMDDKDLKKITPDMSIKTIREKKKEIKQLSDKRRSDNPMLNIVESAKENEDDSKISKKERLNVNSRESVMSVVRLAIDSYVEPYDSNLSVSVLGNNPREVVLCVSESNNKDFETGKYKLVIQKVKE